MRCGPSLEPSRCGKVPPELGSGSVFIVQGTPRSTEGIIKVIKASRPEALEAARDLLNNGMVIVTVIADGRSGSPRQW